MISLLKQMFVNLMILEDISTHFASSTIFFLFLYKIELLEYGITYHHPQFSLLKSLIQRVEQADNPNPSPLSLTSSLSLLSFSPFPYLMFFAIGV